MYGHGTGIVVGSTFVVVVVEGKASAAIGSTDKLKQQASAAIGIAGSVVSAVGYLSWLFNLATIVPSIAVAVRRLHDVGKSGWWLLASLVPVLGGLYLIYLAIQPSDGPNAYGVAPDGAVAASA